MILIQNYHDVSMKDPYNFSLCVWCECGNSVSRFATDPIYIKQPMLLVQKNNQSCLPLIELVLVTTLFALLAIFFPNLIPGHPHVLKKMWWRWQELNLRVRKYLHISTSKFLHLLFCRLNSSFRTFVPSSFIIT